MSKHFKNKTPVPTSRPMHYRSPSALAHLPPAGIDLTQPHMQHPIPPPTVMKHSAANLNDVVAMPPMDLQIPQALAKHLKDSEYLPEAEKSPHVRHDHRPSL